MFFHSDSASSTRTMTAFETRKPCGVRCQQPFSFWARPWRAHSSSTASASRVSSLSVERSSPCTVRRASMTRSSSRSFSAGQALSERLSPPARYAFRSRAQAKRRPPKSECAPGPKPRYSCISQYFKLWRDSRPGRAKWEISYWR